MACATLGPGARHKRAAVFSHVVQYSPRSALWGQRGPQRLIPSSMPPHTARRADERSSARTLSLYRAGRHGPTGRAAHVQSCRLVRRTTLRRAPRRRRQGEARRAAASRPPASAAAGTLRGERNPMGARETLGRDRWGVWDGGWVGRTGWRVQRKWFKMKGWKYNHGQASVYAVLFKFLDFI